MRTETLKQLPLSGYSHNHTEYMFLEGIDLLAEHDTPEFIRRHSFMSYI